MESPSHSPAGETEDTFKIGGEVVIRSDDPSLKSMIISKGDGPSTSEAESSSDSDYEEQEVMLKKILDLLNNVSGIMSTLILRVKLISYDNLGQNLRVNSFQEKILKRISSYKLFVKIYLQCGYECSSIQADHST